MLLGVPHLAEDVRALVLRPGLHRRGWLLLCAGLPLLAAWAWPRLLVGLVAAACAIAVSRAPARRKLLLLALCAALWASAFAAGPVVDTAFAHLHNLVALGLWCAFLPRGARLPVAPLVVFAASAALLWTLGDALPAAGFGLELPRLRAALAPGLDSVQGARLVQLYAFGQAVHYAVWLRLIPEASLAAQEPLPATRPPIAPAPGLRLRVARSLARARADLGAPGLVLVALAALAILGLALGDVADARDHYLHLAGFHAHLELACLGLWLAEGRSLGPSPATAAGG